MIFSSEMSPSYALLQSLGAQMDPLDLYLFAPASPDSAAGRGVYVDPVYF